MRTLFISILASFFVFSAVAAVPTGPTDSWAKIFRDKSLIVYTPYSGTFGPLGIFNVCATDSEFIAISPVKVCIEYKEAPSQTEGDNHVYYECTQSELQIPKMSRTSTQHLCVTQDMRDGHYPDCLEWSDVTTTLPTRMNIEVMHASGETYAGTVFYKEFTVPSCPERVTR
jgi:hypothetical protein